MSMTKSFSEDQYKIIDSFLFRLKTAGIRKVDIAINRQVTIEGESGTVTGIDFLSACKAYPSPTLRLQDVFTVDQLAEVDNLMFTLGEYAVQDFGIDLVSNTSNIKIKGALLHKVIEGAGINFYYACKCYQTACKSAMYEIDRKTQPANAA